MERIVKEFSKNKLTNRIIVQHIEAVKLLYGNYFKCYIGRKTFSSVLAKCGSQTKLVSLSDIQIQIFNVNNKWIDCGKFNYQTIFDGEILVDKIALYEGESYTLIFEI